MGGRGDGLGVSCGFKQGREEDFWFLMLLTGLERLGIEIDFDL